MITNYMETIVDTLLPMVLGEYESICLCEKCIDDIRAIALNNLKPLYVTTEQGSIYAKLNEFNLQFKTDAVKEIVEAAEIVRKKPRHKKL